MSTATEHMEKTARPYTFNSSEFSKFQKMLKDSSKKVAGETAKAATDSAAALKGQSKKLKKRMKKMTKNTKRDSLMYGVGGGAGATVATNHFTDPKDDDI